MKLKQKEVLKEAQVSCHVDEKQNEIYMKWQVPGLVSYMADEDISDDYGARISGSVKRETRKALLKAMPTLESEVSPTNPASSNQEKSSFILTTSSYQGDFSSSGWLLSCNFDYLPDGIRPRYWVGLFQFQASS